MSCADLARIINSDQIQSQLRMERVNTDKTSKGKKNPLTNKTAMQRVNPAAKQLREAEAKAAVARKAKRSKAGRKDKAVRSVRFNQLADDLEASFQAAHQAVLDEIKAGEYRSDDEDEEEEDDE